MCTCVCVCVLCVCVCFSWLCPWRSCCMKGPRVCVWVWVCVQCVFVYGYFRYAFGPAYGVAAVGRGQNWLDPSLRPTHHFNRALTVGRHKLDTFVCWYVCRDSYVWHVTHWYIWYCVLAPPASRPQCHLLLLGGGGSASLCPAEPAPHSTNRCCYNGSKYWSFCSRTLDPNHIHNSIHKKGLSDAKLQRGLQLPLLSTRKIFWRWCRWQQLCTKEKRKKKNVFVQ